MVANRALDIRGVNNCFIFFDCHHYGKPQTRSRWPVWEGRGKTKLGMTNVMGAVIAIKNSTHIIPTIPKSQASLLLAFVNVLIDIFCKYRFSLIHI